MLKDEQFPIDDIYVPAKHKKTLDPAKVEALTESLLEEGQLRPIRVRSDGKRLILVEGYHRMEAAKALGETTILGLMVQAPRK